MLFTFLTPNFRKRLKLGLCIDGKQYVDPNFVKILVNMGYNKEAARVALKHTNNVISDSVQYIQEHPQPGPSQSRSIEFLALINDLVPEVCQRNKTESQIKQYSSWKRQVLILQCPSWRYINTVGIL